MTCEKCSGLMIDDPPRWQGDTASVKCLNCGERKWVDTVIVRPGIPPKPELAKGTSERALRRHNKLMAEQEFQKEVSSGKNIRS